MAQKQLCLQKPRGKHHYSLSNSFDVPVTLQTYPKQTSEPRLRPTSQGEVELGEQIGTILVRGNPHPVYDEVRVVSGNNEAKAKQIRKLCSQFSLALQQMLLLILTLTTHSQWLETKYTTKAAILN